MSEAGVAWGLLQQAVKLYFYGFGLSLTILVPLAVLYMLTRTGSRLNYWLWFSTTFIFASLTMGLCIPFLMLRPRHPLNANWMVWIFRKWAYVVGLSIEMRGTNVLNAIKGSGAIVCTNHQSALDLFVVQNIWNVFERATIISKKEIFYFLPFGFGAWLCNVQYIDRTNIKACYQTLQNLCTNITRDKLRVIIYPEGTRNHQHGLLPFKKGAFSMAIQAQVPIVPMVTAPYYFMDAKRGVLLFDKRHTIISLLDPIPTKGLTEADVDQLRDKTRNVMLKEYEKLAAEVELKAKTPDWVNKSRPRLTLVNRKAKSL